MPTPFKRLTFEEALNRYGIDKPDTRFGMELADFTEEFRASKFKVFSGAVAAGGVVKALNAKGLASVTQGQIETMTEYAKSFGAKGLAYIKVEGGEWKSPIVKFFNDAEKAALTKKLAIEEGDLILFAADQWLNACEILGKIRLLLRRHFEGAGEAGYSRRTGLIFSGWWIFRCSVSTRNRTAGIRAIIRSPRRWRRTFRCSRPIPKKVRGQHYDIVVNGVELGAARSVFTSPTCKKRCSRKCCRSRRTW